MIGVIGGTGNLGSGLALRWLLAGKEVIIGSRTADKALTHAEELRNIAIARGSINPSIRGADNNGAAALANIVLLAVPYDHQLDTVRQIAPHLQGKILIDATVPLVPPRVARVQLPPGGSAALITQQTLGSQVRVVSAFQNVAAELLRSDQALLCDVLVSGDDKAARAEVIALANAAGLRGLHAGPLANSAAAEALTSVLIFLNKTYGGHAGVQITGIDAASAR